MTTPGNRKLTPAEMSARVEDIKRIAATHPHWNVRAMARAVLDEPLDWKGNTLRNPNASRDREQASSAYGITQFLPATTFDYYRTRKYPVPKNKTLAEQVLAAIEAKEAKARAACYNGNAGNGEHWRWQRAGYHDPLVDTPIEPDDDQFLNGAGAAVNLCSIERYPYGSIAGEGPHLALIGCEEVETAVGVFITDNDPATVIAQRKADRDLVEEYIEAWKAYEADPAAFQSGYAAGLWFGVKRLADVYGVEVAE